MRVLQGIGFLLLTAIIVVICLLAQPPQQQAEECRSCHADKFGGVHKHMHPPVTDCLGCHKPHVGTPSASPDHQLLGDATILCQEPCHIDLGRSHTVGRRLSNPTSNQVMDLTCTSHCHDPHGSQVKNILRMNARDLCFSCHNL